jgi:hypothetical protein
MGPYYRRGDATGPTRCNVRLPLGPLLQPGVALRDGHCWRSRIRACLSGIAFQLTSPQSDLPRLLYDVRTATWS